MRRLVLLPVLFAAAALPAPRAQETQAAVAADSAWQPHRAIRVLYAGWPGGSREQVFGEFLRQWFDTVGICSLEKLSMQTAQDYDVVVADWCSQYGNDGYPKRENSLFGVKNALGPEFTKPIIALDYVSSHLRPRYKLDWL